MISGPMPSPRAIVTGTAAELAAGEAGAAGAAGADVFMHAIS